MEVINYFGDLSHYFYEKAKKYKSYKITADRFSIDDFSIVGCNGYYYIHTNLYHTNISNKTYQHIEQAMRKLYGFNQWRGNNGSN